MPNNDLEHWLEHFNHNKPKHGLIISPRNLIGSHPNAYYEPSPIHMVYYSLTIPLKEKLPLRIYSVVETFK